MPRPSPLPLVVTMGEPGGIGGEIMLKAWARHRHILPALFVIDDIERLRKINADLSLGVSLSACEDHKPGKSENAEALQVLHAPLAKTQRPGRLMPENARAVIAAIDLAVQLTKDGKAAGIVTNPIHKGALYDAGFKHPGHTEYLASLCASEPSPVMMLACDQLRVVPVTVHVSLHDALRQLTTAGIIEQTRITHRALQIDFGIANPHLAIAGLNPHAGENGAMGNEEQTIITPAIEILKSDGLNVSGPHPPDTLFSAAARKTYDAAICMYHDQALIPIKTLDFESGVNITLGLDFIRTSPDHGTALDIAGTGKASERSLVCAIQMAAQLSTHRLAFQND